MTGIVCSMVGASFTVAAAATIIRSKKGITAVGNAQIDTAQSKFGGSSLLGDGTGDYLQLGTYSDLSLTGDFTIECWYRIPGTVPAILPFYNSDHLFYLTNDSGTARYAVFQGGANRLLTSSLGTVSANTWYHVAFVRSGSNITAYHNGTAINSSAWLGTIGNTTPTIGLYSSYSLNGWIDEFRISNTARYTTTFTPSTTPFTNDDNTLLLLHMNGTDASTFFEDDNGVRSQIGIWATGNAQIDTAQSKFGGSSALFDSSGDYLSCITPTNAFDFGSGNFTIEFWFRPNGVGTTRVPIAGRYSGSIFPGQWWGELTPTNTMYWGFKDTTGANTYYPGNGATDTFLAGNWYHIAVVRNGNSMQMYRNGTAYGVAQSVSGSFGYTGDIWVGALGPGGYACDGWIDEVRVSKTARYTTNFTAPTAPFVNDANTTLLLHMDGTDASTVFRDDNGSRAPASLRATSTVVTSTTQSKFGGTSIYFPETSGQELAVTMPVTAGSGNFTIEGWVYFLKTPNLGDTGYMMWVSAGPEPYILFNANQLQLGAGGYPAFTYGSNWATNTWYHIAVVRNSGTIRCYANGTEFGTAVTGSTYNYTSFGRMGKFGDDRGRWYGYMDEFRVSNTARYTANFTPSTTPFVNDDNTLLLIHADGTNGSTVFIDDNGVVPKTA